MNLDEKYEEMKTKMCIGCSKNETNALKKNKREQDKLEIKLKQIERERNRMARLLGLK